LNEFSEQLLTDDLSKSVPRLNKNLTLLATGVILLAFKFYSVLKISSEFVSLFESSFLQIVAISDISMILS